MCIVLKREQKKNEINTFIYYLAIQGLLCTKNSTKVQALLRSQSIHFTRYLADRLKGSFNF